MTRGAGKFNSKWISFVSPEQRVRKVARRILEARFRAVAYWLPCAAERSEEDPEFVHQLRVSSRRAAAALRMFRSIIGKTAYVQMRDALREVRRAAGGARDLDVMRREFEQYCAGVPKSLVRKFVREIECRRAAAQETIVALHQQLAVEKFDAFVDHLLAQVGTRNKSLAKQRFGDQADHYLLPALKEFFAAFRNDLTAAENLHQLRIRAKKLRYTIELVEVAYPAQLRRRLYPRIVAIQDVLGLANDHATANRLLMEWAQDTDIPKLRTFILGLSVPLAKGCADLRQAFLMTWTPRSVDQLQAHFEKCCGLKFE